MTARVGLALATAGCGRSDGGDGNDSGIYGVTFTAATPYEEALRLVSDVGLRMGGVCQNTTIVDHSGTTVYWAPWYPHSQRQNHEADGAVHHSLAVFPASTTASDWADRLRQLPTVRDVQSVKGPFSCTAMRFTTTPPAADEDAGLPPQQRGVYAHLGFPAAVSYEAVLDQTTNLGLRLADPCYEQAVAHGQSLTWHPMGQEDAFKNSQALLVATTERTSTRWQEQVKGLPATVAIATDATSQCASG